jgi:class 3 adenylate cyclase
MARPTTRYVTVGDADVAYQVVGDGPVDLVTFFGFGSHLELMWEWGEPFFSKLASFSRLVVFDRRGTGVSDPVPLNAIPTWEEATEDLQAVLDAVGIEQAAIYAEADAGPIAILFAATHPERVSALILGTTSARLVADHDYRIGLPRADVEVFVALLADQWGTTDLVKILSPELAHDDELMELLARQQRSALTPKAAGTLWRTIEDVDVRDALPLVQSPTLILHATDSDFVPMSHGEYLAQHIPGARLIERAGRTIMVVGATYGSTAELIADFLTGHSPPSVIERVLTTVLFSDIVASTRRLAEIGDLAWRRLLDEHDRLVREQLWIHRGRKIHTTGDGFMASFDGPARAIRCAQAITHAVQSLGIEVRVGLHTGECEVRDEDFAGLAVHIAARVGAMAGPGEVLVSGTVKDLVVGSGIEFADHGEQELKGVPGTWRLFAVDG